MSRRLAISALALGACTLTTSLDGLSGGPAEPIPEEAGADARSDAPSPPSDASVDADAGVDSGLGPNLYPEGDFEGSNGAACQGTSYRSSLANSAPAHGGSVSCLVCGTQSGDLFTLDRFPPIGAVSKGEHYRLVAWVRKYPTSNAPSQGVSMELRSVRVDPFLVFEWSDSPTRLAVNDTWQLQQVDLVTTQDAPALDFFAGAPYEQGACFLIDDVQLFRISN